MDSLDEFGAEDIATDLSLPKPREGNSFLAKATLIVMAGTLGSRIFGFIREVFMAAYFGSGLAADAYRVAYSIPNMLLQLFGSAAIGSAFIPVITKYLTQGDEENLNLVASTATNGLFAIFSLFMVGGFFLAPQITRVMAPGFMADPVKFNLTVTMTRIMLPTILFLGMAGFVMGMLHSFNRFAAPAFAPAFFNIAVISSIILLTPSFGPLSLAIGATGGALAQLVSQLPSLKNINWKYSLTLVIDHPGVKEVARLILPIVFSLASIEINVFIDTRFASILKTGSVAALHYALRLWNLPMGLFAVAISTVLFPVFSRQVAKNDISGLKDSFSLGLRLVFLVMIPTTAFILVLAKPIVALTFERGAFGPDATASTAYALVFYTIGLTSSGALHLINRVFYSLKDTLTPTIVAVIAITINYFGNWALVGPLKHGGIALSTSIVMTFNFVCMFLIMKRRLGQIGGRKMVKTLIKAALASSLMAIATLYGWRYSNALLGSSTKGQFIAFIAAFSIAGLSFISLARLLKMEELSIFSDLLKKRLKR